MGKYTKTSGNQNFNDSLLETLAWINFHWQKLILNNKELSLFLKICCFQENSCICKLLQWSSFWICKKIWGFWKKWSLEWAITDSALKHHQKNLSLAKYWVTKSAFSPFYQPQSKTKNRTCFLPVPFNLKLMSFLDICIHKKLWGSIFSNRCDINVLFDATVDVVDKALIALASSLTRLTW